MGNEDDALATHLAGDRKTVAALAAEGDPLTTPRHVDHWSYFPTARDRDGYVDDVAALGFLLTERHDQAPPPNRYCAYVRRVDAVDLDAIHAVVTTLFQAARRHRGEYDGWECPIMSAR